MTKRSPAVAIVAVMLCGCVKDISSDDRLDRETEHADASKTKSATELGRLRCDEFAPDIAKARDTGRTEEERLTSYADVYEQLKTRTGKFDEAMTRNPDLAYQEGSQELVAARDACIQLSADVKVELETMIREIMQVLVVDDMRGGVTVKAARIDFAPLRAAIEKLELDDRDALLQKIANSEKQVDVKSEGRKRNK